MTENEKWIEVGLLEAIPPLGSRKVVTKAGTVALFRTSDGGVFALADKCPHKGGPLSDGLVYGHNVSCPLHGLAFSLESGEGPDGESAVSIPAMVVEGKIQIKLPNGPTR